MFVTLAVWLSSGNALERLIKLPLFCSVTLILCLPPFCSVTLVLCLSPGGAAGRHAGQTAVGGRLSAAAVGEQLRAWQWTCYKQF